MRIDGLYNTLKIPESFELLDKRRRKWILGEAMNRIYGGENVDSSTVSFVRHNFTNYEELLSSLELKYPLRKRATQKEMLERYFAMQEEYKAIKQSANHLVVDMLNEVYGENWTK